MSTTEPKVIPITLEQAQAILADFKAKNKSPNVKGFFAHGTHPYGHGIECWDFAAEDGNIYRAPPETFPWIPHERLTWPYRYMTTKVPVVLKKWNGRHPVEGNEDIVTLPIGTRVKIVMASRFGDVGITDDLTAEYGYHLRVNIDKLSEQFCDSSMTP